MTAHFITEPVLFQVCPYCAAPILSGLAEGVRVRVNIQPVHPVGEIEAIRVGRLTYALRNGCLQYRTAESILAQRITSPLLISHVCGRPSPADHWAVSIGKPLPTIAPTEGIPF